MTMISASGISGAAAYYPKNRDIHTGRYSEHDPEHTADNDRL
jgi:hypothetical protein